VFGRGKPGELSANLRHEDLGTVGEMLAATFARRSSVGLTLQGLVNQALRGLQPPNGIWPFFLYQLAPHWRPASLVIIVFALTSPLYVLIVAKSSMDLTRA
jgi:hypothetical protein